MKVAVIGAGSWGTALAQVAARNGHDTCLWARREEVARGINERHRNPDYLVDAELDRNVTATTSVDDAVANVQAIISVTPSRLVRSTAESLARALPASARVPIVVCTKGVEGESGLVPTQIFEELLGGPERIAALSGPNHAEEIVHGVPAGTVVASTDEGTAMFFQELLGQSAFRVYTSSDVIGVEICAAYKNIIAIAVGVSYGLGYGDNTAAMLMTRGQAEMSRLVSAVGGQAITCMGLAGTGDLIATCMSRHSRNRTFGEALASGTSVEEYEAERHMVVEGAQACKTIATLSAKHNVELPIADVVRAMTWNDADPREVGAMLIARPPKPEFY